MTVHLEGAAPTAYEIYEAIEEIVQAYGMKQMHKLVSHTEMSDAELREVRARVQAAKALSAQLRNGLGYSVDEQE